MRQLQEKIYYVKNYVTNQNVLKDLALGNGCSYAISEVALEKITDENILKEVILKLDSDEWKKKLHLLNKITEKDLLYEIAISSNDIDVRHKAVEKIHDSKILARIILNENMTDITLINKLITKITDITDLKLIALLKDLEYPLTVIDDEEVLTEIAIKAERLYYVDTLLQKIENEENINKIALSANLLKVRKSALEKVTDNTIFESIIKFEKEPEIVALAIKKCNGKKEILKDLLLTTSNDLIIKAILEVLDENDIEDEFLQTIIFTSKCESCRALSALKISSLKSLEYVYRNIDENDWYIQSICKEVFNNLIS